MSIRTHRHFARAPRILGLCLISVLSGVALSGQAQDAPDQGLAPTPMRDPSERPAGAIPDYPTPEIAEEDLLPGFAPPTSPQLLALKYERPVTYTVRAYHRLAIEDRDELKQVYRNALRVTYSPLESEAARPAVAIGEAAAQSEPLPEAVSATPILVEVDRAIGAYELPDLLKDPERNHQVMRQARLSYLATSQGQVLDVRIHAPTHPLARGSIDQMAALLKLSQPLFPDRALAPGDTWEQKLVYRDGEGLAQLSEDSTNVYTLERWRGCRRAMCAFITFKQDLRAAGRLRLKQSETRGTSIGEGEGWLLFDYERGEIVKSYTKIKGLGTVSAPAAVEEDQNADAALKARVVVEYEVFFERVDDESVPPPKLVPSPTP